MGSCRLALRSRMTWARSAGGRFKATLHRVTSPDDLPSGLRRQAITYFQIPNYDAILECLPECKPNLEREGRRALEPERTADYVAKRMAGFYMVSSLLVDNRMIVFDSFCMPFLIRNLLMRKRLGGTIMLTYCLHMYVPSYRLLVDDICIHYH